MTARDTRTGKVLEEMVLPALKNGGYEYATQQNIGKRLGGGRHKVDVLVFKPEELLVSLKWQQVSGTAEQKVPFEVMCLADAVRGGEYEKAYLVLGGKGWSLREFYLGGGLEEHLRWANLVNIVSLEEFVALANQGKL